ncbi:hypothetical protein B0H16DRAFT_1736987 [Mycena metata]|uniref:Uncharacterized protein n=1 Tax=Mycena metata TaxID=1033252 RepID=A0AAD7HNA9_9AGAR|nr:hypothetical protein B0H16DRAFT_1736987 [Mycena metata]
MSEFFDVLFRAHLHHIKRQDASTLILSSIELWVIVFRLTYPPPLRRSPTLVSKIDDLGRARFALSQWAAVLHLSATTLIHCEVSDTKMSRMTDERLTHEPIPPLIALTTLIFKGTLWRSGVVNALLSVLALPVLSHLQILENYVGKHPVTALTSFTEQSRCEATLVQVNIMAPSNPPQIYRTLIERKSRKMHFSRPHRIPGNLEELVAAAATVTRRQRRTPEPAWDEEAGK